MRFMSDCTGKVMYLARLVTGRVEIGLYALRAPRVSMRVNGAVTATVVQEITLHHFLYQLMYRITRVHRISRKLE